jgi:6-phosphogluconolactonase
MAAYDVFFGTYSKGPGKGIFRGLFDGDSGGITVTQTLDMENPAYLLRVGPVLYGVSEVGKYNGVNGGALFSVSLEGEMALIDAQSTHGKHPCHLCVQDDAVYVTNYSEGSLSVFKTDASGKLHPSWQSIYHYGSGPVESRQEAAHIHFAAMAPDKNALAVCDLGMDKVFLYPYQNGNGIATNAKIIECPPGTGPRHLVFSGDGRFLYVLGELSNTVLAYAYDKGSVRFLQKISTLPAGYTEGTAAAIRLSPCGGFVGASNRGHDSIALFGINGDGTLVFDRHVMTGKEPRDFNWSPCGGFLLSANQNDDTVSVFLASGGKYERVSQLTVPKPVCIVFGDKIRG